MTVRSPYQLAQDLRAEADRVQGCRTAKELVACHDRVIAWLIEVSATEAAMTGGD